jgi:predicted regulator of Ras-like GTPase activity (Roadblock/LC7/MglB family)
MFKEALETVVEGTDGGMAGIVMDFEGIALESYVKDGAPFSIDTIGAEFSVVVKAIQRAAESLEAGTTNEVSILSDKVLTIIRVINETYFMALALDPAGNIGKGRYLLRIAAPKLELELS